MMVGMGASSVVICGSGSNIVELSAPCVLRRLVDFVMSPLESCSYIQPSWSARVIIGLVNKLGSRTSCIGGGPYVVDPTRSFRLSMRVIVVMSISRSRCVGRDIDGIGGSSSPRNL